MFRNIIILVIYSFIFMSLSAGNAEANSDINANADKSYTITSAFVSGDDLKVELSFGGGCRTHQFALRVEPQFQQASSAETDIAIAHNSSDDPCEQLIATQVSFDLRPLASYYRSLFGTDTGDVLIKLDGFGTLNYHF